MAMFRPNPFKYKAEEAERKSNSYAMDYIKKLKDRLLTEFSAFKTMISKDFKSFEEDVNTVFEEKADKTELVGKKCGSGEIFNSYSENKADGIYAHAEGKKTNASGAYSHSEGYNTEAAGDFSHAEGGNCRAIGIRGHAEGWQTIAQNPCSHAEGYLTQANANISHAEGKGTIAISEAQHVQGRYNIKKNGYAHIVGNGQSDTNRSNAYTLDWSGNGWYKGTVEASALILRSESGKRFKITVSDNGVLTTSEV